MQLDGGTDREFSASFDHQASATTISFLFLDLSPPKANKTVSFFVSFHRGATKSGILFLVSIARATARRIYRCRPWLSDVSPLEDAPCWCLARLGVARVAVVGPKRASGRRAFDLSGRKTSNRTSIVLPGESLTTAQPFE